MRLNDINSFVNVCLLLNVRQNNSITEALRVMNYSYQSTYVSPSNPLNDLSCSMT